MAAHGARRLLAMAGNAANVVAIELLAAAQGCDFHAPLSSSEPLERVRALLRERVPHLEDDRMPAPEIAAAAEMVRSGALAEAAGVALPAIAPDERSSFAELLMSQPHEIPVDRDPSPPREVEF